MPDGRSAPVKVGRLPIAVRRAGSAAPTAGRAASQAGHLGRQAGLIDEDQLRRIKVEFAVEPGAAAAQDVGAILLCPPVMDECAGLQNRKLRVALIAVGELPPGLPEVPPSKQDGAMTSTTASKFSREVREPSAPTASYTVPPSSHRD